MKNYLRQTYKTTNPDTKSPGKTFIHHITTLIKETTMNDWRDRITLDPATLAGKPVIKGTRISVHHILELLANGWTEEAILDNYPQLEKRDVQSALKYATDILKDETVYPYP
jgi:uncharacterized protein (DUF433 family)